MWNVSLADYVIFRCLLHIMYRQSLDPSDRLRNNYIMWDYKHANSFDKKTNMICEHHYTYFNSYMCLCMLIIFLIRKILCCGHNNKMLEF